MKKRLLKILVISLFLIGNTANTFAFNALAKNAVKDTSKQMTASTHTDYGQNKELPDYENYLKTVSSLTNAEQTVSVDVNGTVESSPLTVSVTIARDGLYTLGMSYLAKDTRTDNLKVGFKIDGGYLYSEMTQFEFPRFWIPDAVKTDEEGNEFVTEQKLYHQYAESYAADTTGWSNDHYVVALTAGTHEIQLIPVSGVFTIQSLFLGKPEIAENYKAPISDMQYYQGEAITIEGENAILSNNYWLTAKSDGFSAEVTPFDPITDKINYIGGTNWKRTGDMLTWQTPELKAGYYKLCFSYRQNQVINGNSYRWLFIDGKTPFQEARKIAFNYGNDWKSMVYTDDNKTPYYVYLSAGKHTISLQATLGGTTEICALLKEAVSVLGKLYTEITMITGENLDIYRDYDLFGQIPDMEAKIRHCLDLLNKSKQMLQKSTGHNSGSQVSVILGMIQILKQMNANKYRSHKYKSSYFDKFTALSGLLNEMRDMPLDIDKILLTAPDYKPSKVGLGTRIVFSVKRFIASFTTDYSSDLHTNRDEKSLDVWVTCGRDQTQILNSMVRSSFEQENGIAVNVRQVNATIVQALLSGRAPDCTLQLSRTTPVNLAMRGALYNLSQFSDFNEVIRNFHTGAIRPYCFENGVYALPDTQNFFMMFYRTDILKKLGIAVPETWEDFVEAVKILKRNNLDVSLPYTQITDMAQVNEGIGGLSLFPSLLLQNGLSLYSQNGHSTTLTSSEAISVFSWWTDFYTKLKIPTTMSFYNRFRIGTCPIGIDSYTLCNTLEDVAPEIDGLWDVKPIPGTVSASGKISHISAGSGTGCSILATSENKKGAWEFLKWWTRPDTQLTYSNNVEAALGMTGRIAVSNTEAMKAMSWSDDMEAAIMGAWEQVEEIPEYPGSYYVSRALDHTLWNVLNSSKNPMDMLREWGKEADDEMARKWNEYGEKWGKDERKDDKSSSK